jgi:2,3-bisphosphoglycerate-independent phosphoglycerate mutase
MSFTPKPLVLIVLDGWGYREDTQYNAIAAARKPTWDALWKQHPHTLIHASEAAVGLPSSQMGNSEVGHLNLGRPRGVPGIHAHQPRDQHRHFFTNKTLTDTIDLAVKTGRPCTSWGCCPVAT